MSPARSTCSSRRSRWPPTTRRCSPISASRWRQTATCRPRNGAMRARWRSRRTIRAQSPIWRRFTTSKGDTRRQFLSSGASQRRCPTHPRDPGEPRRFASLRGGSGGSRTLPRPSDQARPEPPRSLAGSRHLPCGDRPMGQRGPRARAGDRARPAGPALRKPAAPRARPRMHLGSLRRASPQHPRRRRAPAAGHRAASSRRSPSRRSTTTLRSNARRRCGTPPSSSWRPAPRARRAGPLPEGCASASSPRT